MRKIVVSLLVCLFAGTALGTALGQVTPKALTGVMVVTVDGRTVPLTDGEKTEIAQRIPAIKAALPPVDQTSVDWQAALSASQRALVGADSPEQWTPEALLARLRSGSGNISRTTAITQLEVALVAQKFLAR